MKLTLEQISSALRGAVRVEENDGKICLYRFTKEQEELYKVRSADFYSKSFSTSGVILEFTTDSSFLSLEVDVWSGSSRKFFEHSIFVNGKKYASLDCRGLNRGVFSGKWSLPEGENQVKILFPWSVCSKIIALCLDDGATLVPVKKEKKMIMFGDSITHGYEAYSTENTYASRLTEALDTDTVNKGIGGEIFFPELAIAKDPFDPDYITVAYGTNDWSKNNKDEFDQNCREFYKNLSATYPSAKIFAISPIWRKSYGEGKVNNLGTLDYVAEYIEKVTAELPNVIFIKGIDLVPHDPASFVPDILHPNDKGFEHYFNNLITELRKHI